MRPNSFAVPLVPVLPLMPALPLDAEPDAAAVDASDGGCVLPAVTRALLRVKDGDVSTAAGPFCARAPV